MGRFRKHLTTMPGLTQPPAPPWAKNCEAAGQAAFARAVWRRLRAAPLGDPIKLLRFVFGELPRAFDEF